MLKRKPKVLTPEQVEEIRTKDFFDLILPGTIKFLSDHYIVGDSYRCVWAIREYPPSTEEQAILSQLADRNGVTLRIYHRLVESMEQRKIIQNATRRNRLKSGGNDVNETIEAEGNLQDVIELLANLRKNKEPLLHVSVFIELKARSMEKLKELQSDIAMELTRSKISVDRLTLRQKEGFLSVIPTGCNQFGAQYERVLPASSVANMYPFNFSGKTDPHGSYIGRDKYGTNILVDFDRRAEDKTTSNILILGNSGQGKSYLLKLILTNIRESGKRIICLDPESEYEDLCEALGGCYIQIPKSDHEESQEIKRLNAEISKALNTFGFDKEALKQKMLTCVSEKYMSLGTETITAQSLKDIFKAIPPLTAYDSDLTDQAVSEIQPKANGTISLILINGQRIGKEKSA